jgi:apolipoprotein N-acyltransferase
MRAMAAAAGAASVVGFAPFGLWPVVFAGLALLFLLWRRATAREAFILGGLYGIGLYGIGFFWVRISIADFGGAPLPFAVASALLLASAMALYPALAGAVAARLTAAGWRRLVFAAPATWTCAEWLRGWLFTGFPWLQLGYSQIDAPLSGLAPIGGVLGVTLAVALTSGWIAALADRSAPRQLALSVVLLVFGAWALKGHEWTQSGGAPLRTALLQGNIVQEEKWLAGNLLPTIDRYLAMTEAHADSDLIIWPEAAIPALAHEIEDMVLEPLQDFAIRHDAAIVLGILYFDSPAEHYYTSLLSLDHGRDRYDKRHLVPFGEYFPLGFLWKDALRGIATVGEDFTAGTAPAPVIRAGQWRLGTSICYEILFGEEIRQALPRAQVLVNVSNDGWFGDSLGPHQHLEIARMRALETGRYLLRATNTGITAVIGPHGEVIRRIPRFRKGSLTADVEPRAGLTPYGRWGEWPALGIAVLMGFWARYGRRLSRRSPPAAG